MSPRFVWLLGAACSVATGLAQAHVTLPAGGATIGSHYDAAFTVGHACEGAQATTALSVQLPPEFRLERAEPRDGWTLSAPAAGSQGGTVRWTASDAAHALGGHDHAAFVVRGTLPGQPGMLYFPVTQTCDVGQVAWSQIPAKGDNAKLSTPAAKLEVLAAGVAPVDIRHAWVRATLPGQSGSGAFMTLQAPMGARLVGVSTPAAGVAEVHQMSMHNNVMRMQAVPALELPPRQPQALTPGGFHIMLMDLKQPLQEGQQIPLTLDFENAAGQHLQRTVMADVKKSAPTDMDAGMNHHHH